MSDGATLHCRSDYENYNGQGELFQFLWPFPQRRGLEAEEYSIFLALRVLTQRLLGYGLYKYMENMEWGRVEIERGSKSPSIQEYLLHY